MKSKHIFIIDEASNISEEDWKKLKRFGKRLRKMKGDYLVGVDFAKGKGTACFGYRNKKGEVIVDKITEF